MSNHGNNLKGKLNGLTGKRYWRSLEELAETEEFQKFLDDEFPNRSTLLQVDRRVFLKLMGASLAMAGLVGCRYLPEEQIVPYVKQPEDLVLGKPLYYATAMTDRGYALGLLIESHEFRPTKVEGNPDHPASLGATNAFAQASLLNLYDPDRSKQVVFEGEPSTWESFAAAARAQVAKQKASGGAGIRILTETITSPTLAGQIADFQKIYPQAKWLQYEPANRDNVRAGARAAFGSDVHTIYHFDQADRIVSLDADFLLTMPNHVRYAHDFAERRRVRKDSKEMNRLYVAESTPTNTGAMADHRFPMKPSEIEIFARALAQRLGVAGATGEPPASVPASTLDAIARDLKSGRGLIVPGDHLPPSVHALCHAMNASLINQGSVTPVVTYTDPVEAQPEIQIDSLKQLVADMQAGTVNTLIIVGGNPLFTAPADLDFAAALDKVPFKVHVSTHLNETSLKCGWHIPETHYAEGWSDARAYDGTISIVQPLIEPLYNGHSAHEVVSALLDQPANGYDIVRKYWRGKWGAGFEDKWRKALNDGVIAGTEAKPKTVAVNAGGVNAPSQPAKPGIELSFRPDPTVWDGRFANNGWLQELPKPLTKLVWDNAALISPKLAVKLGLAGEADPSAARDKVIEVNYEGRKLRAPVYVLPGHPDDTVTLHYGYGNAHLGKVADGIGFNAYAIRTSAAPWFDGGAEIKQTGDSYQLIATHYHSSMEMEGRDPIKVASFEEFHKNPGFAKESEEEEEHQAGQHNEGEAHHGEDPNRSAFVTPTEYTEYSGAQWAMSIDNSTCIGCNACVSACAAENNTPIVGKDQVMRGREMHWLRIDRYYEGDPGGNPEVLFQPVLCQHCEKAPCEPVCPVAATTHSHEGLNQMIYNRCVGTRYCSNNCPYKVRRFNFLNYANHHEIPVLKLLTNPNVTVRGRGVMEKCSYCVQRINAKRIEAKIAGKELGGDDVVTACQQACPTTAITFGNKLDKNSKVARLKEEPHDYTLLGELNTRPRTTYLAKIKNPNPEITKA